MPKRQWTSFIAFVEKETTTKSRLDAIPASTRGSQRQNLATTWMPDLR